MELREKIIAKPTRVAMDELQLHDLKNMEAAVDVKQKAKPARHEVAMDVSPPASGRDINKPIASNLKLQQLRQLAT